MGWPELEAGTELESPEEDGRQMAELEWNRNVAKASNKNYADSKQGRWGAVGGGNGCVASFNRQMWQCHLLPKSAQPKKGAGVGA